MRKYRKRGSICFLFFCFARKIFFFVTEDLHFCKCRLVQPPIFFFFGMSKKKKMRRWRWKRKRNRLAACRWLGQRTICGTHITAECLSICSASVSAAAGAEVFDHRHGSGSGKRSRSIRDAASPTKTKHLVRGTDCRYAPTRFLFLLYRQRHVFFFFRKRKKKKMWG